TGWIGFYAYGPGGSWSASCTLASGSCSFDFSGGDWGPGTVTGDVSYSGGSVYAASRMGVPVAILSPFTVTAAAHLTISPPGAVTGNTSALTITPAKGFTGLVYFACTIAYYPPGAQHLPACSVPTSVNVTSATPVTAAMTISSTPSSTVARAEGRANPRWLV